MALATARARSGTRPHPRYLLSTHPYHRMAKWLSTSIVVGRTVGMHLCCGKALRKDERYVRFRGKREEWGFSGLGSRMHSGFRTPLYALGRFPFVLRFVSKRRDLSAFSRNLRAMGKYHFNSHTGFKSKVAAHAIKYGKKKRCVLCSM